MIHCFFREAEKISSNALCFFFFFFFCCAPEAQSIRFYDQKSHGRRTGKGSTASGSFSSLVLSGGLSNSVFSLHAHRPVYATTGTSGRNPADLGIRRPYTSRGRGRPWVRIAGRTGPLLLCTRTRKSGTSRFVWCWFSSSSAVAV